MAGTLKVTPTIVALRDKAQQICETELKKTLAQLGPLTPEQQNSLEILAESIALKLLHDPFVYLKRNHHPKNRPGTSTSPAACSTWTPIARKICSRSIYSVCQKF